MNLEIFKFESASELMVEDMRNIDIFFLDIEIGNINGIELSNIIARTNRRGIIFFVTSHANYVTDAMESEPFQYILKPIDEIKLERQIKKAFCKHIKDKAVLETYRLSVTTLVNIFDISHIECCQRLSLISLTTKENVECANNFNNMTLKLKDYNIIKCHKSFLVNLSEVRSISSNNLKLKSGENIPISRKYKKEFDSAFVKYLSEVRA